jgi:hypothetical protein
MNSTKRVIINGRVPGRDVAGAVAIGTSAADKLTDAR